MEVGFIGLGRMGGASRPTLLLIMGVCGTGKSTVGALLARRLGWRFLEADALHTEESIEMMRRGVPLGPRERDPWIRRIAAAAARHVAEGDSCVLACSALTAELRDQLDLAEAKLRVVCLSAAPHVIEGRLRARSGHFFEPGLLESQLETLERPERALHVDVEPPPNAVADTIICGLALAGRTATRPA